MKKSIYVLLPALLSLMLVFSGCSSSSSDSGSDIPSSGKITMKVNGSSWEATGANGMQMTTGNQSQLSIAGSYLIDLSTNQMDTVTIAFIYSGSLEEGEYRFRDGLPFIQITFNQGDFTPQNTYFSKEAVVNVTRLREDSIQGTFSGVLSRDGVPDITITDGGFNVNIMRP